MLTPEQVEGLSVSFERLAEPMVKFLIKDIARRLKEAGQFTSTAAYQIWRSQNLGASQSYVKERVLELLDKQIDEAEDLFRQAAEVGYNFDIDHLPVDAVKFADNASAQQIMQASVNMVGDTLKNITQTIGFVGPDGNARELTSAYLDAADYAFNQVISGSTDLNAAIRRACQNLVNGGIKSIDYASGVHTTIEAAIRRDMTGGLGLMVEQISQQNHDDLGCDGWEISSHSNSAPDHEPIQGRQYTDEEYQRLNSRLKRRIGTLNCGHNAFPIILGVNHPQSSKRELEQLRKKNEQGVTYEGRKFATVYEATQYQRQIERAIRTQKRRVWESEGIGDSDTTKQMKARLNALRAEYKRFSAAVGLRTEDERLFVAKRTL